MIYLSIDAGAEQRFPDEELDKALAAVKAATEDGSLYICFEWLKETGR